VEKQSKQKPGFASVNCCGSKVNVKLCRHFQHRDLCGKRGGELQSNDEFKLKSTEMENNQRHPVSIP
jgi:hypothetical protein